MTASIRFGRALAAPLVFAALLGGCDPAGPGANGTIALDPSVDIADFASLEIRVFPDPGKDFEVSRVPSDAPARASLLLSDVEFPYDYDVSEGVGTSDLKHWRMVAWLSHGGDARGQPAADEPSCTAAFELESCSAGYGGYCTTTDDIDCAIK
jgi:hypothetical protein